MLRNVPLNPSASASNPSLTVTDDLNTLTYNNRRAIIGDPRNDENVIIAQLHALFVRFHNRLADDLKAQRGDFREVQRLVRWHYQYLVINDFLKRSSE